MTEEKKSREWWICFDGVNDRGFWVETKRPSGISGGGNNQSIHVIEYSAYETLKKENERLKNYNELLSRGWPASDILKLQKQRDAALSMLQKTHEALQQANIEFETMKLAGFGIGARDSWRMAEYSAKKFLENEKTSPA